MKSNIERNSHGIELAIKPGSIRVSAKSRWNNLMEPTENERLFTQVIKTD